MRQARQHGRVRAVQLPLLKRLRPLVDVCSLLAVSRTVSRGLQSRADTESLKETDAVYRSGANGSFGRLSSTPNFFGASGAFNAAVGGGTWPLSSGGDAGGLGGLLSEQPHGPGSRRPRPGAWSAFVVRRDAAPAGWAVRKRVDDVLRCVVLTPTHFGEIRSDRSCRASMRRASEAIATLPGRVPPGTAGFGVGVFIGIVPITGSTDRTAEHRTA